MGYSNNAQGYTIWCPMEGQIFHFIC